MPEVRLAEAISALSLSIDIGMGQPLEQGMRTCLIATRLAGLVGLDDIDARRVFYLALLRHVGCTAESEMAASFLGDEIVFRSGAMMLDFTKPSAMFPYVLRTVGAGKSPVGRALQIAKMMAGQKTFMGSFAAVCETGQMLAGRLGFDEVVIAGLAQIFEHWDGKGLPGDVAGEDIVLPARFVAIAELFEGLCRMDGHEAAVDVIRRRSGSAFAPDVTDALCANAEALAAPLEQATVWDDVLAVEPPAGPGGAPGNLTDGEFDDVLMAMADFTDLKSSYTLGHSRGVADLAAAAGRLAGLPAADVTMLQRAGWVHDVGRVGVSTAVWSKEATLSRDDWEKVRLHPYYTERVLTRPAALARLGELASTHHERLDGAGYHRAVPGSVLTTASRILAAADGYRARIEPRPHRSPHTAADAAASLREEARDGRLAPEAVDAVLAAAGQGGGLRSRTQVGGLTEREVEVLRLVARSLSIKEIAKDLTVSPKTVDAHIQHIYTKLGVSTRAGATLFAMEHGFVDRASATA